MSINISAELREGWQVPSFETPLWQGRRHPWCVVVPVINEGARITNLLSRMASLNISTIADIIIVDGGSKDGSLQLDALKNLDVRGLLVKTGPGKLSAQLRCAYAFALEQGYDGIVTIDGNDKDDPDAIPKFIAALEDGVDFVQASRFIAGGVAENTPKSRDFAIKYIHAPALSMSSGFHWTDTTQGFRAYSRKMLLDPAINPFREIFQAYELLAYLSHRAPRLGFRCLEIATARRYPKGEVPTKISAVRGNWKVFQTLALACLGFFNPKNISPQTPPSTYPIFFLTFAGFLFSILMFYPGWMSPDSLAQYNDARAGIYHDWHPVLFAWCWRYLDRIYAGPALLLLHNLLLYWGAWCLIAIASRRWLGCFSYFIPVLGYWPGLLYLLGQIWKDVAFAASIFFAWAVMFLAYANKRTLRLFEIAMVFCLTTYAFGVKTNGLVVLPFVFTFLLYVQHPGRMISKRTLISISALTLGAVIFVHIIVPAKQIIKTSPFQYTQTYDLLAISVNTGHVVLPDYVTNRVGNSLEKLKSLYWLGGNNLLFYNTAGNMTTIEPIELADLKNRWVHAILQNPRVYLSHRWLNFLELLRWQAKYPAATAFPTIVSNDFGFTFSNNKLSNWISHTADQFPRIYFPWIYLTGLILGGVFLLAAAKQHRFLISCFGGSAIAFVAPHILIAPAADYRYLYYAYFCSVIIIFFAVACCGRSVYLKLKNNIY